MQRLRILGSVMLTDSAGTPRAAVLRQPKRLALLSYLAVAKPGAFEQRDRLLALFWPELDTERARDALNTAVRFLRRELGDDVLVSRGVDAIGVNADVLTVDVTEFRAAAAAERHRDAVAAYGGDLLDAFHCDASPEFGDWLDRERTALRREASRQARLAADLAAGEGDISGAVALTRTATALADGDERSVQHAIRLLDRVGDRAAAIATYEEFVRRLRDDFGIEPSPETRALVDDIRARASTHEPVDSVTRTRRTPPDASRVTTQPGVHAPAGEVGTPDAPVPGDRTRGSGSRRVATGVALAIAVVALSFPIWRSAAADPPDDGNVGLAVPSSRVPPPAPDSTRPSVSPTASSPVIQRVAVLPFENLTGDSTLGYVGDVAAAEIASGVLQAGLRIVDLAGVRAAMGRGSASPGDLARQLADDRDATLIVRGTYALVGDSLRFLGSVTDARTARVVFRLDPEVAARPDPFVAIASLRDHVVGGVTDAEVARRTTIAMRPPRYPARQEYLQARREDPYVSRTCAPAAMAGYQRAIAIDSMYVEPYIAIAWCTGYGSAALDSLLARLAAMRPALPMYDQLQADFAIALNQGRLDDKLALAQRAYELTRSPLWAYRAGYSAIVTWRPQLALRYLAHSDSGAFEGGYAGQFEALRRAHHMLGSFDEELRTLDRAERAVPEWGPRPFSRAVVFAAAGDTTRLYRVLDSTLARASTPDAVSRMLPDIYRLVAEARVHRDTAVLRAVVSRVTAMLRRHESGVVARTGTAEGWHDAMFKVFWRAGYRDSAKAHFAGARYAKPPFALPLGHSANDRRESMIPLTVVAQAYAFVGDTVWPRAIADSLATVNEPHMRGQHLYWRAVILATLGDLAEATRLLHEAYARGNSNADWHLSANLMPLRGYPPFEAMINPERHATPGTVRRR